MGVHDAGSPMGSLTIQITGGFAIR